MADSSQACAFAIKILDGTQKGRVISLEGRALPYRGVEWETEMRLKTTYYPGNPVATQQTIGPIEKNTVITGMWKDIFLGNGAARRNVQVIRDLVRTAQAVEVTWGIGSINSFTTPFKSVGDPIVRRGFIKRIKAKFDRPQDVTFDIEFEWRGADDQTKAPVFSSEPLKLQNVLSSLSETLATIRNAVYNFNAKLAGLTDFSKWKDALDDVQNTIAAGVDTLNTVVDSAANVAELPNDLLDRTRESFAGVVGACQNGRKLFDAIVGDWTDGRLLTDFGLDMARLGKKMAAAFTPTDDPLKFLDATTLNMAVVHSFDKSSEDATQQDVFFAAQQIPEVIATVRPPVGSDLRDIAIQFYDDPDMWWQIADYNGLDSSEVPPVPVGFSDDPARAILIPRKATGANAKPYGGAGC